MTTITNSIDKAAQREIEGLTKHQRQNVARQFKGE